mmetsp:Transcript_31530/g.94789  ORF Transcript_31530/g.94789 Transcript_31530/m.94789 type:complete len:100 (+) Transcript_31530:551-850(+)
MATNGAVTKQELLGAVFDRAFEENHLLSLPTRAVEMPESVPESADAAEDPPKRNLVCGSGGQADTPHSVDHLKPPHGGGPPKPPHGGGGGATYPAQAQC